MNRDELLAAANELCRKHWGVDYTGDIELVNRRWTRTNGQFIFYGQSTQKIVMSRVRNAYRTREEILGTLLHELVHWRLLNLGQMGRDTDISFIRECVRVGAPISGAKNAQNAYKRYLASLGRDSA
ncbi:hypothetical protein [Paenibacillus sp. 1P03SA]|uniref:hypothetical protein n=1 Tax=Paenibacillus sp. 1P03SA TaxID=3132294 RepID=UPI00399F04EE